MPSACRSCRTCIPLSHSAVARSRPCRKTGSCRRDVSRTHFQKKRVVSQPYGSVCPPVSPVRGGTRGTHLGTPVSRTHLGHAGTHLLGEACERPRSRLRRVCRSRPCTG